MSENRQRPHKATPPGRPTAAPYTQRPQELGSAGRHALPSILRLIVLVLAALSLSSIPFIPPATTAQAATVGFTRKTIFGTTSPGGSLFAKPTTLAIGPDNRLYVGQQNGYIHALTLDANKNVTAVQVISTIYNTPNKNDDGTVATGVVGRTQLGLAFDPASTAAQPILYVTHSDPRIGVNNNATGMSINTRSGMITRLVGPSFDAPGKRADLVTDLPRSRENHATNGLSFGPDGWLYNTQGGDTNSGAPAIYFSTLPERYLTAAVLRTNVNSPSFKPISARKINGPADEIPGLFEVYATGYRNAYDLVWHSNGKLYLNDNGSNQGLGTTPGPADGCPSAQAIDIGTRDDQLHLVFRGAFGGHPNPIRGECVFEDGTAYSPALPRPANYTPPLVTYVNGDSTDGIVEYRAATFGGAMVGNLISATWSGDQNVRRVQLTPDGTGVQSVSLLGAFNQPLDVWTDLDGVIYVAEHGGDAITLMLPSPATIGAWTTKAPLPTARAEVATVVAGGKVYVIGGVDPTGARSNSVYAYDPIANTWSIGASYPGPALDHAGAASVNGIVYLIGGLTAFPKPAVATVYAYNPATNSWAARANMPSARGAMGVAVVGGKIYAAGGLKNGVAVNDLTAYDPVANTWATLASMPTARDHLVAESVGGKLYAVGGRNTTIGAVTGANQIYNPATNSWSTGAPLPTPRGGAGSGVLGGRIQVFGGEGNTLSPSGTFSNNDEYDPAANAWRALAPMQTPRHGMDGATVGNVIFVPGGAPTQGLSATTVDEAFTETSFSIPGVCPVPGSNPTTTDSDGDGYKDKDELDNGTDPCSMASIPPDFDKDLVSDRNDTDDDNDGIPDVSDQLFFDAGNGARTAVPVGFGWNPGDPPLDGVASTGFTGVQLASTGPRFSPPNVSLGAAGLLNVTTTAGTNEGTANSQENALQLGFDATRSFRVSSRISQPFAGKTPAGKQAGGIFLGLDQDNYVKLVVSADNGTGVPGVQLAVETNGSFIANPTGSNPTLALPGPTNLDLFLEGDPISRSITAYYRVDSEQPGDVTKIGTLTATNYPALAGFFRNGLDAGVLTTNAGATASLVFGYDFFQIDYVGAIPVRTNSGGGRYSDAAGNVWYPDSGYVGGTVFSSTAAIAGTADPTLYRTERFGNVAYSYPLPNGMYSVTLKFAELYWSSTGQRVFNVTIEGQTVLSNFDILSQVPKNTALDKTFQTYVADGKLDIVFTTVRDNAKIDAILASRVNLTLPARVNAGDGQYTDSGANVWVADISFRGGSTFSTTAAISGTADPKLYQSERYGNHTYSLPVPNGTYTVTLKFAELYWNSPGQRVFNVTIEGWPALTNFDILSQVPKLTALDKSFKVTVTDGSIDIVFAGVVEYPKISAIQIQ